MLINIPLVSIIVISYKQKDYIDDCMQSLLNLTYSNIELLYLDDCSLDGTYQVACQYEKRLKQKFGFVQFTQNTENKGLIHNLNGLIEQSRGKYVKFIAADDFLMEDSIAKLVDYLEEHGEHDMVYANGVYGNRNTHFQISEQLPALYRGAQPQGKDLFQQLYVEDFIAAPAVMIRREVYERLGLYDTDIGIEDWEYFLRIAKQGSIGYLDAIVVMYRHIDDSLSHSSNPKRRINMQKSGLLIQEKYKDLACNGNKIIYQRFNDAYRDALHINDRKYFRFLKDYAKRNTIEISLWNRVGYILYKLGVFRLIERYNISESE